VLLFVIVAARGIVKPNVGVELVNTVVVGDATEVVEI